MQHIDTLVTERGRLTFHFKLHTPPPGNPELPDPPYIFIDYITAEPRGSHILQRHAGEMIARIRAKLNSDRTIIFQPANGQIENGEAQGKLEAYYRSCGFDYLPSSEIKWWMTWPQNAYKSPQRNAGIGPATLDSVIPPRPALSSEKTARPQSPRG